mgnify:CR=1 FL=1|jgi:uncharacterized protein
MVPFLLIFLFVYGGLNTYLYFTIAAGLGQSLGLVGGLLVLFVLSPILLRISEGKVPVWISSLIALVAYSWMGVSFLFASFALLLDIAQLIFRGISESDALFVVAILTSVSSVYAFYEFRNPRVRMLRVTSPKFEYNPEKPFRIVQVSDIHLGFGSSYSHIRKIVRTVDALKPDLLVSTGDLFDSNLTELTKFAALFRALNPPKGKIAVTGNHEVYAGLKEALELTEAAGFKVLRSAAFQVDPTLFIMGVDDPEVLQGHTTEKAEMEALRAVPLNAFKILLKHRPHISPAVADSYDLQLSGHTHGGQIFPFIFLTRLQYQARHGLSRVSDKAYLYLSRGTGAWGPQLRFFAPPEITVFELAKGRDYSIVVI